MATVNAINTGKPIGVGDGGTGRITSDTAYAVLCAGTTAAGVHQTIASVGSATEVLTSNGAGALPTFQAAAGAGGMPFQVINIEASSGKAIETTIPALLQLNGTNVRQMIAAFDTSTEEFINGSFIVSPDLDTAGTITFRALVMASTGAADKNVALTLGHLALTDNEDFDPSSPYTDEDIDD